MSKYGEREDRVTDSGFMKIADILPRVNDEIEAILVSIEERATKDGSKSYGVYTLFTEERGEIVLVSFGSNFDRVIDKAIKDGRFNGCSMPFLAIGVELVIPSINQRTGEAQEWHNVYIEKIKEPNNKHQADIDRLRTRANAECKNQAIEDGKPYAPAVAAARQSVQRELEQTFAANTDEIPF